MNFASNVMKCTCTHMYVLVITWQGGMLLVGLFRPTPEGATRPRVSGGINRNIPTMHVIIDLLPIMTSNAQ